MIYFAVKNFSKHQHYKDRTPPWIKLYNDLLDDYDFACLQDASKLHLVLIWLLASRSENKIPYDSQWISSKISATEKVDLKALEQAGFILKIDDNQSFKGDDSVVLADCKQSACLEREEERETEKPSTSKNKFSDDDMKVAEFILAEKLKVIPDAKKPNLQSWANSVRKTVERDKRSHRDICELFRWAINDSFWQGNIQCPDKLRKQWDQLTIKKKAGNNHDQKTSGLSAVDKVREARRKREENGFIDHV